ncbi:MAG TPA: hypothetical protein VMP00_01615 [Burkholderiales bacterium]|nr:hypothetical protein [Burkholderiales bacterium]
MTLLRRALILLLPVVLLLAQHGAMAHVLSHVDGESPPAHEQTLIHLKLCGKCLAVEKFSHAAPSGSPVLVEADLRYSHFSLSTQARCAEAPAAYRTRAPPSLV